MATKNDLEDAKREEQIKKIKRQGKLAAANEYISFAVSKMLGVGGLGLGGLELLDPSITPLSLSHPTWVAGAGVALLTGKTVLSLIAKVDGAIGGAK
ncbi:MAG: hypothetical protein ACJ8GN_00850 [Longimicrobiaceae bacterium]